MLVFSWLTFPVIVGVMWLFNCIKILNEYERGVVFRLGRMLAEPVGPGLTFLLFPIDRMQRTDRLARTLIGTP